MQMYEGDTDMRHALIKSKSDTTPTVHLCISGTASNGGETPEALFSAAEINSFVSHKHTLRTHTRTLPQGPEWRRPEPWGNR